jgi:hypothetical protein
MSSVQLQTRIREERKAVFAKSDEVAARKVAETLVLVRPSFAARLIGLTVVAALIAGFYLKKYEIFVPSEGVGYKLGIAGGSTMLLLLLYPMVKRTRLFGGVTKAAFWFKWHMVLGVVGPVMIFYHSNFSIGATNSNIALVCMILVAGSGVAGRYIYAKVHNGVHGARLDVGSLLAKATRLMQGMEADVGGASSEVIKALADFSESALPKSSGLFKNFVNAMTLPVRTQFARERIMSEVSGAILSNAAKQKWSRAQEKTHLSMARQHVSEFLGAVSRAAQLTFWERIFSLWHLFHVPLFFLLLVSGVIHVIAVHLY